jgi:hypothetical protein
MPGGQRPVGQTLAVADNDRATTAIAYRFFSYGRLDEGVILGASSR